MTCTTRTKAPRWLIEGAVVTWKASPQDEGQAARVIRLGSSDPILAGDGATVENLSDGFRFWTTLDLLSRRHPPVVEVDTAAFEVSHARRPSGRGGWAFCFSVDGLRASTADATHPAIFWAPCGLTYGESKRLAIAEGKRRAEARGIAFVVVEVMS